MIKSLSDRTAEQLCAQQVITSLPDSIKELIDNSIDARATYIKIMLFEYGKKKVEVIDNGMGIDNFDFLGKKGSTSKNKGTENFEYLGFRGQAVHSIGRMSGGMTIESKAAKDGYRRKFNVSTGSCEQFKQERLCHGEFNFKLPNREGSRNTGTKVVIEDIFKNLPVRHIELHTKFKEFLKKTNDIIKEFCLIYPEIQFIFMNTREGKEEVIIETISHQFFNKMAWLQRIKELDERIGSSLIYISNPLFQGFVLNKIESGSSRQNNYIKRNYHYLYINRRPTDIQPILLTSLNEIYKKYNNNTKYAFVLNLKLDHQHIDVNLSPNKRQIFIRKNVLENIIEQLKKEIIEHVIEDVPTLSNFQEKKDASNAATQRIEDRNQREEGYERKTISFPLRDAKIDGERVGSTASDKNSVFRVNMEGMRNNLKPQLLKKANESKTSKSDYELPELPKINVDMSKLKEELNRKMGLNVNLKRLSLSNVSFPTISTPNNINTNSQKELQAIRKENQEKKVREEQSDAKKRSQFLSEVKLEQIEEEVKRAKAASQKSHVTSQALRQNSDKKRQPKPNQSKRSQANDDKPKDPPRSRLRKHSEGLMEQEVRREQESQWNNQTNRKLISQGEEMDDNMDARSQFSHASDKQMEARIKTKISLTDMSQIFTKFNKKMSGQANGEDNPQNQVENQRNNNIFCKRQHQQAVQHQYIREQSNPQLELKQQVQQQLGNYAARSLRKQHFRDFEIIGQFNTGFIICLHNNRIYMVDQHAASQKANYEAFLNSSKHLESINCFDEKQITIIDADSIEQTRPLLTQAGFFYEIRGRSHLLLLRCPIFNEKKLGMQYFFDIVEGKKELNKVKRFVDMSASMACRKAVMVGLTLNYKEMKAIVSKLSELDSPWNCPHGRPTLIELGVRQQFKRQIGDNPIYVL